MRRLLSVLRLWILALPLFLNLFGAGMNQAVLAANHDRFPVMLNEYKVYQRRFELEVVAQSKSPEALDAQIALVALEHGYLDSTHVLMGAHTHLNWLADYIDLHSAIYSPGDLILAVSEWLWSFAPIAWITLLFTDLWRRAEVK